MVAMWVVQRVAWMAALWVEMLAEASVGMLVASLVGK